MTNAEKFKETFGKTVFDITGYCDNMIELEIWEEQEYQEVKPLEV